MLMTTDGQVERMLAIHREWKRANAEDDEFRIENVRQDTYVCPTTGESEALGMGGFDVCCDHPECPAGERSPGPGEPAITFYMEDDRVVFRDQAALDEYLAGALAPLQALVSTFEAKYGIQSSPVSLLRDALTRVTSPDEQQR